jgi:hypothetical protein
MAWKTILSGVVGSVLTLIATNSAAFSEIGQFLVRSFIGSAE